MKYIAMLLVAVLTVVAMGDNSEGTQKRHSLKEVMLMRYGGMIVKPGSLQGKVVVANAQTSAKVELMRSVADEYARTLKIVIEVKESEKPSVASAAKQVDALGANIVLFVVDDKDLPTLLSVPESRWVMVNVARLTEDADEARYESRVRKELVRGLALVLGAQGSAYPNALMSPVTKVSDLDAITESSLPVDVLSRFPEYMKSLGVTPARQVRYRDACQQGWAPQPTNDYQRVIWEEYHSEPTEPIRIKYDPKKGL